MCAYILNKINCLVHSTAECSCTFGIENHFPEDCVDVLLWSVWEVSTYSVRNRQHFFLYRGCRKKKKKMLNAVWWLVVAGPEGFAVADTLAVDISPLVYAAAAKGLLMGMEVFGGASIWLVLFWFHVRFQCFTLSCPKFKYFATMFTARLTWISWWFQPVTIFIVLHPLTKFAYAHGWACISQRCALFIPFPCCRLQIRSWRNAFLLLHEVQVAATQGILQPVT